MQSPVLAKVVEHLGINPLNQSVLLETIFFGKVLAHQHFAGAFEFANTN